MSHLTASDLRIAFGGVRALDGVSIEVTDGSCCGIIGPNGSGKTTLLGAISRLTPLDTGHLSLAGTDYTRFSAAEAARLGVGRTFQAVRFIPSLTVLENVMVGAASRSVTRGPVSNLIHILRASSDNKQAREIAKEVLSRVGMLSHADTSPHDLPYGSQRKVEIARALAVRPKLLLLDEPTAGMSRSERAIIANLLTELTADGLSLVLVEHDFGVIRSICDTSYVLDFGRVIASGSPNVVAEDPAVREAYLGHGAAATGRIRS